MKHKVSEADLTNLHKKINKICLDIAIERGKQYNSDNNMVGSYQEYSIDDIASIVKVKMIRVKHTNDSKVIKDSCIDSINYLIEILRRML